MQALWRIWTDGNAATRIDRVESFGGSVSGTEYAHDIPLAKNEMRRGSDWSPPVVAMRYIYADRATDTIRGMTDSEKTAADAAEQAILIATIAATTKQIGPMVQAIQTNLLALGQTLPADSALVTGAVLSASASKKLTTEQEAAKMNLAIAYLLLRGAGIEDATINAVWKYMEASK